MTEFHRSRAEGCLSDLKLDRLLRHEQVDAEARAHLEGCAVCRERLATMEGVRAKFQASPPPLRRRNRRYGFLGLALAAAAALLFMLRPDDGTRLKGGSSLGFFVKHEGKLRRGQSGERVAPGDTLQFVYSSAQPFHGAILSIDGAKQVSRYFPEGARAVPLEAGTSISLPQSTILDAVSGRETIYGLFCDGAVELEPLQAQLAQGRALDAPGCHVDRIEIDKP